MASRRAQNLLRGLCDDLYANAVDDGVDVESPRKFLQVCTTLDELLSSVGLATRYKMRFLK